MPSRAEQESGTATLPPPAPAARHQGNDRSPTARAVLITLAVIAVILLAMVIYPFASALLVAAVLAAALEPWCERLARRLGRRRALAAALVTIAVTLLLVLPAAALTVGLGKQVADGVQYVRETLSSEGVSGIVADLPPMLRTLAQKLLDRFPSGEQDIQQFAGRQGGRAAAAVGGVLTATSSIIFQTIMMLIALYFLLVDGRALVDWVSEAAPLKEGQTRELLSEFRNVSVAVLVSSAATAAIQAAVAMVGYLIAGAPQPLFFTLVTFIMAVIPAVGAGSVGVAVAALVFIGGKTGAAIFLLIWGTLVVGFTDNFVKPYLIKGRMEVHGAVIFFALLGGLALFGTVGLLAGPLIVAFFLAVVRICRRELGPV